jgi:hypothetical protein
VPCIVALGAAAEVPSTAGRDFLGEVPGTDITLHSAHGITPAGN